MIVKITDSNRLVATGSTATKLSFLMMKSPGNLKSGNLGKSRNAIPRKTNTTPRTIRNRAILYMKVQNLVSRSFR